MPSSELLREDLPENYRSIHDRWISVISQGLDVSVEIEQYKKLARGEVSLPDRNDPNFGGWSEFDFGDLAAAMEQAVEHREMKSQFVGQWQRRLQRQTQEQAQSARRRVATKTLGEAFRAGLSMEQRNNLKNFIEQFVHGNNLLSSAGQRALIKRIHTGPGPWLEPVRRITKVFERDGVVQVWRNFGQPVLIPV